MKVQTFYINEYTGAKYSSEEECHASEVKSATISARTGVLQSLNNGDITTQEAYTAMIEDYIYLLNMYEPSLAREYKKGGKVIDQDNCFSYYILRVLGDSGSEIYNIGARLLRICPKCFRFHDQIYNSTHCLHTMEPKEEYPHA